MTDIPAIARSEQLRELAAKVEAAAGPSFALETEIYKLVRPDAYQRRLSVLLAGPLGPRLSPVDYDGYIKPPTYTASLDAAISMVPEGFGWNIHAPSSPDQYNLPAARIWGRDRGTFQANAATPAIALCAAALRALAGDSEA
jgi:hypothetical protein